MLPVCGDGVIFLFILQKNKNVKQKVLRDENDYTKDEIKEIYKKIDLTDEKIYDEDILEENGWFLEDTVTYIVNGVTIE